MSSSSMEQGEAKAPNKGKRKIPIEPITNKTRKQVTFSKRRGGLFKKGSELCSLCGAEVAIITFSGAGKFFGFGHPSDEAVIQRYINSFNNNDDNKVKCNEHFFDNSNNNNNNNTDFGKYSQQYKDVIGQIEVEKRASTSAPSSNFNYNGVDIKNINNNNYNNYGNSGGFWWDENIDELGLLELEQFKVALEGLRNEVAIKVEEMNRESMSIVPQNFDFGAQQDGNTVAHYCQSYDGSSSSTCWIDHGMERENFNQMAVPVDSYVDLLTKRQA